MTYEDMLKWIDELLEAGTTKVAPFHSKREGEENQMGRDTAELLLPEPCDLAEDTGKCNFFFRQRHCWHELPQPETKKQKRRCCFCGRTEQSNLQPAGHGPYTPAGENLVLVWTPWTNLG